MTKLLAVALLGVPLATTVAQEKGTELAVGLMGIGVTRSGGHTTGQFEVGHPSVGVGFFVSPALAIQASAAIIVVAESFSSDALVQLGVAVPIYRKRTWGHTGFFVAPGAGVTVMSPSGGQLSVGVALGHKLSVAEAVSLSLSGRVGYAFANASYPGAITVTAQLGLSVFFRASRPAA
jgi:hypothetical protein